MIPHPRSPGVARALVAGAFPLLFVLPGCSAQVAAPAANPPSPAPPSAVAAPPPTVAVAPPAAPILPPAVVDPVDDARFGTAIRLDLDALRTHSTGRRMGKAIAKLEPLKALASPALDPLRDLDKVVWLGTTDVRSSRGSQVIETKAHEAELDLAVRRLAPVAAEAAASSFVVKIGKRSANATLAPGTVALLDLEVAPFSGPLISAPPPGELVQMRLNEPGKSFPSVPRSITKGTMTVTSRDDGGVEVTMAGTCADEAEAKLAQKVVAANVQKYNVFPFRLITRKALDTAKVSHEGPVVTVDVALSKVQVEAFAQILADEMNADLSAP